MIEMQAALVHSEKNPHEGRWIYVGKGGSDADVAQSVDVSPYLSTISANGVTVFP